MRSWTRWQQRPSPALRRISESFVQVMLERDIPLEAVLGELFLSGEVERTYRLLRTERDSGFAEFKRLKEAAVGPDILAFEQDLRRRLGELATQADTA